MGGFMSSVIISGDTSGAITLAAPAVAGTNTITLPANTGTVITTASTAAITQAMLSTAASSIGVGQTWTDVTSSRAIGTTYTNSTGKPIMVIISGQGAGVNGLWGVTLNSAVSFYTPSTYTSTAWTYVCFIVPNNNTYALSQQGSGATMQNWSELR
jgi:hypothetical protein